jgi:hypothetical protein
MKVDALKTIHQNGTSSAVMPWVSHSSGRFPFDFVASGAVVVLVARGGAHFSASLSVGSGNLLPDSLPPRSITVSATTSEAYFFVPSLAS